MAGNGLGQSAFAGSFYLADQIDLFRLNNISLVQFKNYPQQSFSFDERIIGICGNNGVGKTNLLDAIYYLCFTRSYFAKSDLVHILHGTDGFRAEGHFSLNGRDEHMVCVVRDGSKKECALNGIPYLKFSEHLGKFPAVMIAPDDVLLITGGSEERRKWLDALISQVDPAYLQALIQYNKILQQRNGLLKSFADGSAVNRDLLGVYDQQLVANGQLIFDKRRVILADLIPRIANFYQSIGSATEAVELKYESQLLQEEFPALLKRYLEKDILLQRTLSGIHRDDIDIALGPDQFRVIASQGQRKSMLFAMKLAEYELLAATKGFPPLLLLDDVFEKLDAKRMQNLLHWVCVQNQGQIFITDTHRDRISEHLSDIAAKHQLIEL